MSGHRVYFYSFCSLLSFEFLVRQPTVTLKDYKLYRNVYFGLSKFLKSCNFVADVQNKYPVVGKWFALKGAGFIFKC